MPIIWSALIVTAMWTTVIGAYFAFRDDAVQPMTEMQITYEKRIDDLRTQLDRVTSQQLLDQERNQQQLNELLQRQATPEQSSTTDSQLATGSISAKASEHNSIASGPPAAEPPRATAASTPKSASARHRHASRAQRRAAARAQQHDGDQAVPAAAQLDLGQRSLTPE
jgi:hypothetical protein